MMYGVVPSEQTKKHFCSLTEMQSQISVEQKGEIYKANRVRNRKFILKSKVLPKQIENYDTISTKLDDKSTKWPLQSDIIDESLPIIETVINTVVPNPYSMDESLIEKNKYYNMFLYSNDKIASTINSQAVLRSECCPQKMVQESMCIFEFLNNLHMIAQPTIISTHTSIGVICETVFDSFYYDKEIIDKANSGSSKSEVRKLFEEKKAKAICSMSLSEILNCLYPICFKVVDKKLSRKHQKKQINLKFFDSDAMLFILNADCRCIDFQDTDIKNSDDLVSDLLQNCNKNIREYCGNITVMSMHKLQKTLKEKNVKFEFAEEGKKNEKLDENEGATAAEPLNQCTQDVSEKSNIYYEVETINNPKSEGKRLMCRIYNIPIDVSKYCNKFSNTKYNDKFLVQTNNTHHNSASQGANLGQRKAEHKPLKQQKEQNKISKEDIKEKMNSTANS